MLKSAKARLNLSWERVYEDWGEYLQELLCRVKTCRTSAYDTHSWTGWGGQPTHTWKHDMSFIIWHYTTETDWAIAWHHAQYFQHTVTASVIYMRRRQDVWSINQRSIHLSWLFLTIDKKMSSQFGLVSRNCEFISLESDFFLAILIFFLSEFRNINS